jgi:hypothetical protein
LRFSILTLLLFASVASAQARWSLTTADFRSQHVELRSIDTKSVRVMPVGQSQQEISVPLDDVLQIQRTAPDKIEPGRLILHVTGGGRLGGEPVSVKDEQIVWKNSTLGEISLPLRNIAAITLPSATPNLDNSSKQTEDIATLSNGDVVKGIVTNVSTDTLTVRAAAGDEVPVPLSSVVSVVFASTGPAAGSDARAFSVRFADGSAIRAKSITLGDGKLTVVLDNDGDVQRPVALPLVMGIEQINGPVSWLSSRTPSESVHNSFFDTSWRARMDQTVRGEPIRFAEKTYTRGIGVHAQSMLTFPLDGSYQFFRTQYAIDGDLPYADVTVRIKLDDRLVHEAKGFKAGILAPIVQLDLKGAKSLTLEVDYGGGYDVQDRFNWIEPALVRTTAASPAPATQPH